MTWAGWGLTAFLMAAALLFLTGQAIGYELLEAR